MLFLLFLIKLISSTIPNCLTQNLSLCQTCYPGFTFVSPFLCVPDALINFCDTYSNDANCSGCLSAFTLSSDYTSCNPTHPIAHCTLYNVDGTCLSCLPAFNVNSNHLTCDILSTITNCQDYNDNGTCNTCVPAFTVSTDQLHCLITNPIPFCTGGYYSNGSCTGCPSPFKLSQDKMRCQIKNCQTYQASGQCQSCYSLFTISSDNLACTITISIQYCSSYNNDGTCTACATTAFAPSSDGSKCQCLTPVDNCQTYHLDGVCSACFNSFTLVIGTYTCVINSPINYCLTYQNNGSCKTCIAAFTPASAGTICSIAVPIPFCTSYLITGQCQTCPSPYILSSDQLRCQIVHCLTYLSTGQCQNCFSSFTKSSDGLTCTITTTIPNCVDYEDNGTCKACDSASFNLAVGGVTCDPVSPINYCSSYRSDGFCLDCTSPLTVKSDNTMCQIKCCQVYLVTGECQSCYAAFTKSSDNLYCTITTPILYCGADYQANGSCTSCVSVSFSLGAGGSSCNILSPIAYCQFYQSNGSCKSCFISFTRSHDSLTCTIISPINFCNGYWNDGTCKICLSAFTISADSLACLIQNPIPYCQMYQNNGSCQKCINNYINARYGLASTQSVCCSCLVISERCLECLEYLCTKCEYPYQTDALGSCTSCMNGYSMVGSVCLKNGCINEVLINGKYICISCMTDLHFIYNQQNHSCVCQTGYKLTSVKTNSTSSSLQLCESTCGDGNIAEGTQECDDGNVRNQDGCNQNCKVQQYFQCRIDIEPSQCILFQNLDQFQSNYVYKVQGENKCKFSFSVSPQSQYLQYVEWQNYLTVNLSSEYIISNTLSYKYQLNTHEITLSFEYSKDIEDVTVQAKLTFDNSQYQSGIGTYNSYSGGRRRLLQGLNSLQQNNSSNSIFSIKKQDQTALTTRKLVSSTSSVSPHIFSIPPSRSLTLKISGINQPMIFEQDSQLKAYQIASVLYVIVTVLILVQFFVGSYVHKLIGLQTLQIFQLIYFFRIIIPQTQTTLFSTMNALKYTAFGGYSNYQLFYQIPSSIINYINFSSIKSEFLSVQLSKYLTINVNISLILIFLSVVVYLIVIARKYYFRNNYIKIKQQLDKDKYTIQRRRCEWVYNHLTFPYALLFNMIVFFSTVIYLESIQSPVTLQSLSSQINLLNIYSYPFNLSLLFLTIGIYCYEIFLSYQEYHISKLSKQQREKLPASIIQKLQHDDNNPDSPNYKPGYLLVYLVLYFIVQMVIVLDVFIQKEIYAPYILIFIFLVYLIIIWIWQPYNFNVRSHNLILRYNHVAMILFMILSVIISNKSLNIKPALLIIIIYLIIVILALLMVLGYFRIFIEYQYRSKVKNDMKLLLFQAINIQKGQMDQQQVNKLLKRQLLRQDNPFIHKNQFKQYYCDKNNLKNKQKNYFERDIIHVQNKKVRQQLI